MRPSLLNPFFVPLGSISGVGPKSVPLYERLLGESPALTAHLAMTLPHRLIDRRLGSLNMPRQEGELITVRITVEGHRPPPARSRAPYRVMCDADGQSLTLLFFNVKGDYQAKQLPVGETRVVSGRLQRFDNSWQMAHPDFILTEDGFREMPDFEPVYPLTAGLGLKQMQKTVRAALASLPDLPEWQDGTWLSKNGWQSFLSSLKKVHYPTHPEVISASSPYMQRLAYDELLASQLALFIVRGRQRRTGGRSFGKTEKNHVEAIASSMPFSLTGSQEQALEEIWSDLGSDKRMLRLLQGDVGSGKTIVALMAAARVAENGAQTAIMAPTEILARQHLISITELAAKSGLRIGLLTGKDAMAEKRKTLEALKRGEIDIIIGTHALFQEGVEFSDLGLVVIDEQHRFGVHQRLALTNKATEGAELLVMTATPIPRTLVLSYFGDMDVSKLTEKPKGRLPIDTRLISMERLSETISGIERQISAGAQVYWVCPLVEESELLPLPSAEERYQMLKSRLGEKVGLIHGRMGPEEKQRAMEDFTSGKTRLLVATTVIEVGVNVPNATIMVIEHAERFGLAQLHQLRGRVGRGEKQSTCLLLYGEPLSKTGKARLSVMRETEDGFKIAEEDLKLRGEGEILGTRQSGEQVFRMARLEHHRELLEAARDDARLYLTHDPMLVAERGKALRILLYLFEKENAVQLLSAG